MKKLLKKKVNVFGKTVPLFVIALFAIGLASALLVPYLSNTITGNVVVDSPMELVISDVSGNVDNVGHDPETYSISLHGGESFWIETTLTNNVEGLTGYIGENKIADFDGAGITMSYYDPVTSTLLGPIPSCGSGSDWYYYVGEPTWPLPAGTTVSNTTVETAINLEPGTYIGETRIVASTEMACTP